MQGHKPKHWHYFWKCFIGMYYMYQIKWFCGFKITIWVSNLSLLTKLFKVANNHFVPPPRYFAHPSHLSLTPACESGSTTCLPPTKATRLPPPQMHLPPTHCSPIPHLLRKLLFHLPSCSGPTTRGPLWLPSLRHSSWMVSMHCCICPPTCPTWDCFPPPPARPPPL